jgi:flagellar motor switch protein FliM
VKPERTFIAERVAAQHCPELINRGPDPAELTGHFARAGERFTRHLAGALAPLVGGEEPVVAALPPRELGESELTGLFGPLASYSLLASAVPGVSLLAAVEGAAVLRLVDRAFGGKGEPPQVLPETFPGSAELMVEKLEALIALSLGEALEQQVLPLRRSIKLDELAPFPAGARLALLTCEVAEGARSPWKLALALPQAMLARLFGQAAPVARAARAADPAAQPFADMPLPLTATLVDMRVPLAAISALEPGAVLPVSVARAVPLSIAGQQIARGTIGAQDDRVAVKLTQIA